MNCFMFVFSNRNPSDLCGPLRLCGKHGCKQFERGDAEGRRDYARELKLRGDAHLKLPAA